MILEALDKFSKIHEFGILFYEMGSIDHKIELYVNRRRHLLEELHYGLDAIHVLRLSGNLD